MGHEHAGKSSEDFIDYIKLRELLDPSPDDVLLDAGCGNGHISVFLSDFYKKVVAVDKHTSSIDTLKDKTPDNVDAVVGDVLDMDIEADVVLMVNVLHGFVHNGEDFSNLKKDNICVVEFTKKSEIGPPADVRLGISDMGKIFPGYKIVRKKDIGDYCWGCVLEKVQISEASS